MKWYISLTLELDIRWGLKYTYVRLYQYELKASRWQCQTLTLVSYRIIKKVVLVIRTNVIKPNNPLVEI